MNKHKRSSFSGKLGFVLSAAGASVGLGNIWRFPYLAAKYGGGIFLLIYIILALTFGYSMIMAETSLGRMTRQKPGEGAICRTLGKSRLAVCRRMDQRHHPDSDRSLLFCYRRMGYQISGGIFHGTRHRHWPRMNIFPAFISNGVIHGDLLSCISPLYYLRYHLCRCTQRN